MLFTLTSDIQRSFSPQRLHFPEAVHGCGAAAVYRQIHHLVKGHQLYGVELTIIDRLSAVCKTNTRGIANDIYRESTFYRCFFSC